MTHATARMKGILIIVDDIFTYFGPHENTVVMPCKPRWRESPTFVSKKFQEISDFYSGAFSLFHSVLLGNEKLKKKEGRSDSSPNSQRGPEIFKIFKIRLLVRYWLPVGLLSTAVLYVRVTDLIPAIRPLAKIFNKLRQKNHFYT